MKIIILGAGKVGKQIISSIADDETNDTVVIDLNPKKIEEIVNQYDVIGVTGNGATYDILMEAGANEANLIVCVTESDELNILAGLMAKHLGTKHVITRVRNLDYSKQRLFMQEQLGISMIINPEMEAANEITRNVLFPSATKVESFTKGRVELVEFNIKKNNKLVGVSLNNLSTVTNSNVLLCAVNREEESIIPTGDFVIETNDHIFVTGSHKDLMIFSEQMGETSYKIKNVMIIGGGRIAIYLAKQLTALGIKVKIIENNHEKCVTLSRLLPYAAIIEGDASDEELLLEEGLETTDAFISLTGLDEENVILSLFAKQRKVKKSIAKVTRLNFTGLLDKLDIDSVVTPKSIVATQINRYIRAKESKDDDSSVKTLYRIAGDSVEALEFIATNKFIALDQPLSSMSLKKNVLVATICRGNEIIIPKGNTIIQENDHVIIVANKQKIKNLSDIIGE